ncbi:peptide/nickel transport system permease protein [Rhizobiales bacterium GAS113]|jgi:peptide/nickel transport system permease protein|nr:peptide/nickel transport system permease protein [Rhizobiales bacterium GAS113]SEB89952.1 peptide/nickel transport system permease protein [Rhizobiales bacterium GAS188]
MLSASYVGRRLAQIVPTLILAVVLVFLLAHLLPGDPAIALLGERATSEAVERTRQAMGVDRPLLEQFGLYVQNLLIGDLGRSMILRVPVAELISQRLPVTVMLTIMSALLAACIAVPFALLAALHRGSALDTLIRGAFQLGVSMPVFYIGLVLLIVLAAGLGWFPVGGFGDTIPDHVYHLALPALTLAMSLSAILMRNLRASLVEVLDAEYVTFATAKGLTRKLVVMRHVLRNAAISTVTLFGLHIGTLIGGAVITETVFAIPGLGRLMVDSIFSRDYQVVQGLTLVIAVLVSLVFLMVDIVLAMLDPRHSA